MCVVVVSVDLKQVKSWVLQKVCKIHFKDGKINCSLNVYETAVKVHKYSQVHVAAGSQLTDPCSVSHWQSSNNLFRGTKQLVFDVKHVGRLYREVVELKKFNDSSVFKTFICIFLLKSSVQSVVWQECMREDVIGSKQSHEHRHHHHYMYQCRYWSMKNKHFNPETPTRPRPSHISPYTRYAPPITPPIPEHPGESLNSVQALQTDKHRKDKDMKDEEYWKNMYPSPQDVIMTSRIHLNRNGPEETKTNIISSHSVNHWDPANQRKGPHVFRVTSLAEWCKCWRWRGAEYLYSVAEELLPPGGEQKYTHRYVQNIQTESDALLSPLDSDDESRF